MAYLGASEFFKNKTEPEQDPSNFCSINRKPTDQYSISIIYQKNEKPKTCLLFEAPNNLLIFLPYPPKKNLKRKTIVPGVSTKKSKNAASNAFSVCKFPVSGLKE